MRDGPIDPVCGRFAPENETWRRALEQPGSIVALLIMGQIAVWTLAPALVHLAPPLDVVEGYLLGREWIIVSHKHPALPSWALEISRLATGVTGWPAYLVSQLFVAATFMFVFLLGRDLMGARRAAGGTLLLCGVVYYAWPTPTFDHNIAQMPFWAALSWTLWRAVERRSVASWLLVAVCGAGGLYAKLSTGLLLVSGALWMLCDRDARRALAAPAPWIGLAVFAALVAPLAGALVAVDFSPLKYAALRGTLMPGDGVDIFLLNVLINLAGVPLMLAAAGLLPAPSRAGRGDIFSSSLPPVGGRALGYMLALTLGPLLLAVASALLSGLNLRSPWSTPMFALVGLVSIALTSNRFGDAALRRLAYLAAGVLVVVPLAYVLVISSYLPASRVPPRVSWPQGKIAERMRQIWTRETGKPLRIVTGEIWIAGLIALAADDHLAIPGLGDFAPNPRVSSEKLEAEGALVVWSAARPQPSQLPEGSVVREERFPWRYSARHGDLVIKYAIIPPREAMAPSVFPRGIEGDD